MECRLLRWAARTAIEHQPVESWTDRALQERNPAIRVEALLGLSRAGTGGLFDSGGLPAGHGWDAVQLMTGASDGTYALEVSGNAMLPLYRDGDIIVVSPTAQTRRGDRVVVRTRGGEVLVKVLHRQTAKTIELHALNADHPPRTLELKDIEGMGRIIWASQ